MVMRREKGAFFHRPPKSCYFLASHSKDSDIATTQMTEGSLNGNSRQNLQEGLQGSTTVAATLGIVAKSGSGMAADKDDEDQ